MSFVFFIMQKNIIEKKFITFNFDKKLCYYV